MQSEFSDDDVEIRGMSEADLDQIIAIEKKSFAAPWSRTLFRDTLAFPSPSISSSEKKLTIRWSVMQTSTLYETRCRCSILP